MGKNSLAIEVQIEKIGKELERLSLTVKKMVKQYIKINGFLVSQERVLTK